MVQAEWWCWCLKGRAPHLHQYLTDGTSRLVYID